MALSRQRTGLIASSLFWVGVYLALVASPLMALLLGRVPPGAGIPWDFAMALGFAGMVMIGVQFALTARFRRASVPFGIDIIYYFHRYMAVVAFLLIAGHAAVLVLRYPAAVGALDPRAAPWYMTAGVAAFLIFAAVIVTSLWRRPLGIEYDRWRLWHAALAVAGFVAALAHIEGVGRYINAPAKQALWTAFMLLWVALIVYVRLVRPWRLARRPYRVTDVRKERGRSWTLAFEPVGHAGMAFRPGQFAWLTLRASPFSLKEHPFSFSSPPSMPAGRVEVTIKEFGDFTRTIGTVAPGETAYLDGPYGAFCADRHADAPGFVFIAGGVGIAPIMSMLRAMAGRGETRPLVLFYGNRLWENVVFREECEALRARLNLTLVHVLWQAPDDWRGERGFITGEVMRRHLPADFRALEYFVCGPQPMIDLAERDLRGLGVPLGSIHAEIFDLA